MAKKKALKKILVVDDEEDIIWSLKEFLVNKELQAEVFTASSGEEALEKLAQERIDLVITDIKMPGMSGLDLLVEIKNRFPYIVVIIMTAFPSSDFKRESLLKGGLYFIEKPFDIKMVREKVIEALRETGQFKGVLTGINLGVVIQIKCMSESTEALRVTEGSRQGIIFFQRGEIIHAICDELEGEEAFYEIMSFPNGHLDSVNIIELPERTISKPYVALLMEGVRRQDEQEVGDVAESAEPAGKKSDGLGGEAKEISSDQAAGAVSPGPPPVEMSEQLAGFKTINGYLAAAIMRASGEIVAQDDNNCPIDLDLVCQVAHDFFRQARQASGLSDFGACDEALLGTGSEALIMGCNPDESGQGAVPLVLAVFSASGNKAMGFREIRKVVARLAAAAV
ncbi:MAG: response regulator [Proteobacteria bacterium]|nr:response regulator [Pseudomonadota bacterium]MBU1714253.1 response regulator [Pseudomonadota bacterium]